MNSYVLHSDLGQRYTLHTLINHLSVTSEHYTEVSTCPVMQLVPPFRPARPVTLSVTLICQSTGKEGGVSEQEEQTKYQN